MRSTLVLVVCLAVFAIAGTFWFFGSDGPVTDDPDLPGAWYSADAGLRLDADGRYVLAFYRSNAIAQVECGKWRALEGNAQMRIDRARGGKAPTLREPGLRAGSLSRRGDELAADLRDTSGATTRLRLSRATPDATYEELTCDPIADR